MKRSEMELRGSKKLQKSENLFIGYKKGNVSLKCLCDNLSSRILKEFEEAGMLPPHYIMNGELYDLDDIIMEEPCWEPEDEEK